MAMVLALQIWKQYIHTMVNMAVVLLGLSVYCQLVIVTAIWNVTYREIE